MYPIDAKEETWTQKTRGVLWLRAACSVSPDNWFFFFVMQAPEKFWLWRYPLQRCLSLSTEQSTSHRSRKRARPPPPHPPGSFVLQLLVDLDNWPSGLLLFLFSHAKVPLLGFFHQYRVSPRNPRPSPLTPVNAEPQAHALFLPSTSLCGLRCAM